MLVLGIIGLNSELFQPIKPLLKTNQELIAPVWIHLHQFGSITPVVTHLELHG